MGGQAALADAAMETERLTSLDERLPAGNPGAVGDVIPRLSYRPALDGIRAIAVSAVVAYHLGIEAMPGGFLGVDVFFVLSGYLITSLLLLERDATGSIDLGRFWMRRARRLLPALLLLLVVAAFWIHETAPDFELAQRRADLQWTLLYGSNWHLIASAQDYFAQGSGVSIVRHAWSLAIEEQFYLVWPLIVAAALWVARARTTILVAVCGAGVAGSIAAMALLHTADDLSRAYYGTDTRVHQLLIGALFAIAMLRMQAVRAPRKLGTPVAALALASLVTTFMYLDDGSSLYYRGLSALVAVLAGALIWGLEVSPSGALARALGTAPMRGIGRISYGIYLWHWPVILVVGTPAVVFEWLPDTIGLNLTCIVITMAIATLSFALVERPALRSAAPAIVRSWPRFGRVTAGGFTTLLLFTVVSLSIGGLTTSSLEAEASTRGGAIELDRLGCTFVICVRHQAVPGAPVVAVIGDSIARSLDLGFVEQAKREGWTYLTASAGGCRVTHLLTSADGGATDYSRCFEATPGLFRTLSERWQPDVVIVIESVELADFVRPDGRLVRSGSPQWESAETRALVSVVGGFTGAGSAVVLVEAAPAVFPEGCLRHDRVDDPGCIVPATEDTRAAAFNRILSNVATSSPGRVSVVSMNPHLCPSGRCAPVVDDGIFARYDGHHFSKAGARWLVPLLLGDMRAAGVPLA